ncbi:hypothetical protein [Teichococcus coralli]|nr:hypothetical protein [Pseudoroseomonas coralli]
MMLRDRLRLAAAGLATWIGLGFVRGETPTITMSMLASASSFWRSAMAC